MACNCIDYRPACETRSNGPGSRCCSSEISGDPDFRRVWQSLSAFHGDFAVWQELSRPLSRPAEHFGILRVKQSAIVCCNLEHCSRIRAGYPGPNRTKRGSMMRKPVYYAVVTSAICSAGNSPANAAGDAAAGNKFSRRCALPATATKRASTRPARTLFGVYGRKAGSTDFPRYKGLVGADFSWDAALLDQYLQDPKAFVTSHTQNKTTAMTYSLEEPEAASRCHRLSGDAEEID